MPGPAKHPCMQQRFLSHLVLKLRSSVDLDIGYEVARVPASQLTPLSFHRDYVARNKPVIITGAIDAWPAMHKWSAQYMADKMGPAQVRLHGTQ